MADESKYPTRIAPYGLRMPDALKTRIQLAAEENKRSMNAEIVAALEDAYPLPDGPEVADAIAATMADGKPREIIMGGEPWSISKTAEGALQLVPKR